MQIVAKHPNIIENIIIMPRRLRKLQTSTLPGSIFSVLTPFTVCSTIALVAIHSPTAFFSSSINPPKSTKSYIYKAIQAMELTFGEGDNLLGLPYDVHKIHLACGTVSMRAAGEEEGRQRR
jgi:hypothetical protein